METIKYTDFPSLTDTQKRRVGTTTGCFTTQGNSISGNPEAVFDAAIKNGVRRLNQTEVNFVTKKSRTAQDSLTNLLDFANKTREYWQTVYNSAIEAKKCSIMCGSMYENLATKAEKGAAMLREMGQKRVEAFTDVDMLMIYAQSPSAAQDMCRIKQKAWSKYQEIINKMTPLVVSSHQINNTYLNKSASLIETLLKILQEFMALIQNLITLIANSFSAIVEMSSFFAKYPQLMWATGGLVALGILAFIFRPYISIFQAVV